MFKYFLLGLIAGFALGLTSAVLLDLSATGGQQGGLPDSAFENQYDGDFRACLEELSSAVSEFSESNQRLSNVLSSGMPVSQSQEKMASPASGKIKAMNVASDWASVLDRDLARALVEHGKTPYDPEVAPLLKDSATKLHYLELTNKKENLNDRRRKETLHDIDPEYRKITRDARERARLFEEERARIITEFFSAISSLE